MTRHGQPFGESIRSDATQGQHLLRNVDLQLPDRIAWADDGADQLVQLSHGLVLQIGGTEPTLGHVVGNGHRGVDGVTFGHHGHCSISLVSTTSASTTASSRSRASAMIAAGVWVTL